MATIERIEHLDDPRVAAYRDLRDATLKAREGLFVAEGRLVVRLLLEGCRYRARSVFVSDVALAQMRDVIEAAPATIRVFVAGQGVLDGVAGFALHRGCVALGERGDVADAEALLRDAARQARLIVVAHDLTNHDNMGGVFRNAAAFGAGAVLVTQRCCDPLYRKAIRVSMGHALRVPFGLIDATARGVELMRTLGWKTVALTPAAGAVAIGSAMKQVGRQDKVAVFVGTEGEGLPGAVMAACDVRVRIGMAAGVDSLNVATASGIALQRFAEAVEAV
ncbi:MAG: RNA methyltransferase [Phycisphaerales bacterium]|nr:RNA methyltransferase [Phycisphaerales bacterium]